MGIESNSIKGQEPLEVENDLSINNEGDDHIAGATPEEENTHKIMDPVAFQEQQRREWAKGQNPYAGSCGHDRPKRLMTRAEISNKVGEINLLDLNDVSRALRTLQKMPLSAETLAERARNTSPYDSPAVHQLLKNVRDNQR